jgi:hypothetical protein
MFRIVVTGLLVVAVVEGMTVRRQAEAEAAAAPDCQFPLLPVLKVCPPCQPASCYCANGKELTSQDQAIAEQNRTLPCDVTPENQYGLPARCDCLPPGEGFLFQDVIAKLQAQQQQAAQQAQKPQQETPAQQQQQQQAAQPQGSQQAQPQQESRQETPPAPAPSAAGAATPTAAAGAVPSAQDLCPRPLLPVLNACPPCSPSDCFCADGKKLTLEDQAKANENKTPPCSAGQDNPHGLPARCNCDAPGTGFTFQEILALLAAQQAALAKQSPN